MACRPVLDELSLPAVTSCGINVPCPDLLTPERVAAAIWSWAPGEPYDVKPSLASGWSRAAHDVMQAVKDLFGGQQVHAHKACNA